jgi:N6-adenosine-specific RNA methylase IME4
MVQIKAIHVDGGLPKADDPRVAELVESIEQVGLLNPITLTSGGDSQWKLIAGRHRLAAMKARGESVIDAHVLDLDELGAELATIDENLIRRVMPALERSEQLARRKEIYEAMRPTAKTGGDRRSTRAKSVRSDPGFAKDTAKKTGVTERSVQQYVAVAKKLDPEVKKKIAKTPAAESLTELTKLARMPAERQRQVAERVAKGGTVKAATRELKRAEQVAQVRAHTPPVGQFEVIAVDPPWPYEDQLDGSDAARGATPYPTMTIDEIRMLELPLAKNAAVFLWVTNSHLVDPMAYAIVATSWQTRYGLVPKQIRTWVKPRMGLGRVWRNDTEHLVLFTRGEPVFTGATQTTHFDAPLGKHSEKPQRAFDDIEALCASSSRLEMFARGDRPGWVTNGAEVPKESERLGAREPIIEQESLPGWVLIGAAYERMIEGTPYTVQPMKDSTLWQFSRKGFVGGGYTTAWHAMGGAEAHEDSLEPEPEVDSPDAISWKPKKHPTVVAVGESKTRRWTIEQQKRVNDKGKKFGSVEFFWRCEKDSSQLFDTEALAKTDAAQQELLWQSEESVAVAPQMVVDDGTLCGIRPSKNGDHCILKQGHDGVHSNGRTTWSEKKKRKLVITDVPAEA